jgi:hypothetical protein
VVKNSVGDGLLRVGREQVSEGDQAPTAAVENTPRLTQD